MTIACLFGLSMLSIIVSETSENRALLFLAQRFNPDVELSFPTLYNYFLILSNAGLLTLIYLSNRAVRSTQTNYWLFLAIVMFLMGYDEAAQVHERLADPMRAFLPDTPLFTFAWTPVGALAALIVAATAFSLLRRLSGAVAALMILAGVVYLTGALGIETLGGLIDHHQGRSSQFYVIATIEESFEMLGMAMFGQALLLHISQMRPPLRIPFS